jgi:hypothetical protein
MKWIDELEKMKNPDPGDIEPMPDPETQYAMDERQAIIAVDGGQDKPYSGPVDLKSRELPEDELLAVHRGRGFFQGTLVP